MSLDRPARARPSQGQRHDGRGEPARRQPRAGLPAAVQALDITGLQRLAGNRAVARMLSLQRCGPVPPDQCGCHSPEDGAQAAGQPALQRSTSSLNGTLVVQRHKGFRTKGRLETEVLAVPPAADGSVVSRSRARGGPEQG